MPETTDPDNSRRTFLNWLLGSSAGVMLTSIFYPLFRFISPPRIPEATTRQVEAGTTNDPELIEKGYKIVSNIILEMMPSIACGLDQEEPPNLSKDFLQEGTSDIQMMITI